MGEYTSEELAKMSPADFRSITRKGKWTETNHDVCRGYGQGVMVALPQEYAYEFLLFCHRNPRCCPLLDATEPGNPHPTIVATGADLRTDLPRYRIFKDGQVIDEPTDATKYWRDDLVSFVLGCSRGIKWELDSAHIKYRRVGTFFTNIRLVPAGRFYGYMTTSCLAFPTSYDAVRAIQISSRLIAYHGPPVHIGDPNLIGIKDICKPDISLPYTGINNLEANEVVLFWGCAITPQTVAELIKVPYMISSKEGHLFVTDKLVDDMAIM